MRRLATTQLSKLLRRQLQPVNVAGLEDLDPLDSCFGTARGTPIDRYYIARHLEHSKHHIRGRVLEVAELRYALQFGAAGNENWTLQFSPDEFATDPVKRIMKADLSRAESLPENEFDCFICTQTLNSIFEFKEAMHQLRRLLKPGGVVTGTLPGVSQVTRFDADRWGDYWRFTEQGVERLLSETFGAAGDSFQVKSYGNMAAAIAMFRCLALEDLPDQSILNHTNPDYPLVVGFVATKG